MFDLIMGTQERPLRKKAIGPKVVSMVVHVVVATLVVVIPLLLGGIVGGLVGTVTAPPPPQPMPPPAASAAQLTGLVILEARSARTDASTPCACSRSRHPFLDKAAVDALKQWQYTPLVLNGVSTPFVLTVTFNFSVTR